MAPGIFKKAIIPLSLINLFCFVLIHPESHAAMARSSPGSLRQYFQLQTYRCPSNLMQECKERDPTPEC